MSVPGGPATNGNSLTRRLLICGAAAGPIYIVLGTVQILVRDGFDMRRHALSHLANGELGWIQIANFVLTGMLVLAGATGVRRRLQGSRGGRWGPILLRVYGACLIAAGVFVADPAPGFPPGSTAPSGMSTAGLLHLVSGAVGFYAIIAACFVFARRFAAAGRRGWFVYSLLTGAAFLLIFTGVASGSTAAVTLLALYAIVAWTWIWHAALSVSLIGAQEAA
ncbi:MAG TPA: DUF998 domain-containing protein [Longimicrobiales bacterium]|nr:DUF998 domain-containing protein [Longimicrobiales bacterium]